MSMDTSTPAVRPSAAADPAARTPENLGIGMRLSIHPHCDDFVPVILGALDDARADGLEDGLVIETDEVSTYVGARSAPAESRLLRYAAGAIAAAHRRSGGGHVVAHILLSRGCPGEVNCSPTAILQSPVDPIEVPATGVPAVAQWSLYPLIDADSGHGAHMAHIEAAIADAKDRGIAAEPAHYATKLTGDLAEVLATAGDAWQRVGTEVPHVVSHLTVSVASPTPTGQ